MPLIEAQWIPALLIFAFIALASHQIGQAAVNARLPLITGYLLAGIIAGPYMLGLIPLDAPERLRFLDEISLGFIAFAAGAELYLRELRGKIKTIAWVTTGLTFFTFTLASLAVFLLLELVPFAEPFPFLGRIAVAILAGGIMVARSPSSAIAIINELRAKGPFTQVAIGVTVIMDVVVIVLFAVTASIADAIFTGLNLNLGFIALLALELAVALGLGLALWKVIEFVLTMSVSLTVRAVLILAAGYSVFVLSAWLRTTTSEQFPFEVLVEPLLVCMLAGFLITNFGDSREVFARILHDAGPPVYVVFFTLTGASLALDVLADAWILVLALVIVRLAGIFIGSFAGGALSGAPAQHNRVSWMAYVTQAGIALGLAKEVAVEFPPWGASFATLMIGVVVVNQLIGPPLFKSSIRRVKESHTRALPHAFDGVRDALIFGSDSHAAALAHQLIAHGWQVKLAALDNGLGRQEEELDIEVRRISELTREVLDELGAEDAEAVVAMMRKDDHNYEVLELAYEHFGIETLVVRLQNRDQADRFQELGALIVDPGVAIVSLLDQFVRSPEGASLLLGMHEDQDVIDLELRDPMLHGIALKHLRLPGDVLILSIRRGNEWLVTHGYTRMRVGDKVTVVGSAGSLEKLALQFEV